MGLLIKAAAVTNQVQDILIEGGRIRAIGPTLTAPLDYPVIDASGLTALAGFVDCHVHLREPGFTDKETIASGSRAAAKGGFTTILAMPNVDPVVDSPALLQAQVVRNQADGLVHIQQIAAISAELTGATPVDMAALVEAGAVAFSNDGHGVQEAQTMYRAMQLAAANHTIISAHLEDDSLAAAGVVNDGPAATALNLAPLTSLSEETQLARDLLMVAKTGCRYHVCHVSSQTSVNLIRQAKAMGLPVTAEVTPHHLLLDDSMIDSDEPNLKMNPPLRSRADRLALIGALLDGTIDFIATDHAPHTAAEKTGSMCDCSFGIVGLETAFPLLYTAFVKSGLVPLSTLSDWLTHHPIDRFHLTDAGRLRVGDVADLTLVDLSATYPIRAADFASKGKNSPFIGWTVTGRICQTLVAGQLVYAGQAAGEKA
ncbi:dihydroorotase [Leuconostocaceae bacterium ESL0958]|nr:dihydroorotase [Leuconostocaceae bacterium ESL0958]